MVKRIFSLMLLLCAVSIGAFAQSEEEMMTMPLPLNPKVLHGTLPNGLNYYIMHNEEPKGRANFYIAQKVGSTLETKEQLGLAHFLEHMAFNGTKSYPGKSMLNYLQNNGIRFGADINAYTGFDETVYNINNVPTNNQNLMDSVLLVLHDWSCDLLLEDAEIDAERGVIHEEWRSRNDANTRMFTALLPQLYDEYQYTQMPIGLMEIVDNFPYQDLRDYYHKWYRPDQQGIVIVGDFDAAEMEQKVIALFTPIVMPENAAERTYAPVADNQELRYATFQDPELQMGRVMFSIKFDKTPFEMRNTIGSYIQEDVIEPLICDMINNRLSELSKKPDCPFAYAGVSTGDYWVSKTKGAFDVTVIPKDNIPEAFKAAMGEVMRSLKTGFTPGELTRVRDEMLANLDKQYNERDKTNSEKLAREIIRHFVDNNPTPGIEMEKQMLSMLLPQLPVEAFNEVASAIVRPDNQVLAVITPSSMEMPTREVMEGTLKEVLNAEYEAYEDVAITEPLIAELPARGAIVSCEFDKSELGVDIWNLSNGAKVIVKKTDFAADDIQIKVIARGGKSCLTGTSSANLNMMDVAFEASKVGNFDNTMMEKYMAGKKVKLGFNLGNNSMGLSGNSTVKDLPTAMELIYAYFTELNPDTEMYSSTVQQINTVLANQMKNPQVVFMQNVYDKWFDGNPARQQLTLEDVNNANYEEMLGTIQSLLGNARDYTFVFVGNISTDELAPLVEQYIATLPSEATPTEYTFAPVKQHVGNLDYQYEQPMESPQTMVFDVFSGSGMAYTEYNAINIDLLGEILDIVYTATLREEEGGTYGASCQGMVNPYTNEWSLLYIFGTGSDKKEALEARAYKELCDLMTKGAKAEDFNKVKSAAQAQYEINVKKNSYWVNAIDDYVLLGINTDKNYKSTLDALTLADFNKFMKELYKSANMKNGKKANRVQVIMNGVPVEK